VLTNDPQFAERITNPLCKAPTFLTDEQLDRFRNGVVLSDGLQIGKHRPLMAEEVQQLAGGGCLSTRRQRGSQVGNYGVELTQGPTSRLRL
jgi:hypothetical protein